MTVTAVYIVFSTVLFLVLAVLLNGGHWLTTMLKIISIGMFIFGVIVGLASSGIILSNGIRLV
jgi:hypothetical protein